MLTPSFPLVHVIMHDWSRIFPRDIPSGGALELSIPTKACAGTVAEINKLEHVVLTISFIHRRRGDVSVLLMSPSGTKNEMLSTRHYDDSKEGLDNWGFMTVHTWGKWYVLRGLWTLAKSDTFDTEPSGCIQDRHPSTLCIKRHSCIIESLINRGYYTVARRYEFYFWEAKHYPRVSKYCFCHEQIKFISSTRRVMFFLLYRQKDIDKIMDFYSPKSNCDGSNLQYSNIRHCLQ